MSELNEYTTIIKDTASRNDLDFDFLREQGIKYIEALGSKLWTDYNSHDPGITMLEVVSYAITDLGSRIALPMNTILAEKDNPDYLKEQFLTAERALPIKPVTPLDYRKLFIDLPGIKNAWIKKFKKTVYADCKNHKLAYKPFAVPEEFQSEFILNGLYEVLVEFDELDETVFDTKPKQEAEKKRLIKEVRTEYHAHRNLCEDIVEIRSVEEYPVAVCAQIELDPQADEEKVQALIEETIEEYLSPTLRFYSLKQMLQKGYTTDQIYNGPFLENGFIEDSELRKTELRKEVRLSDIIDRIMKIEGVDVIRDITIQECANVGDGSSEWLLCVPENQKPTLCHKSVFSFYKGFLPLNINKTKVEEYKQEFKDLAEANLEAIAAESKELELPESLYLEPGAYTTIQNELPDVYGISEIGIKSTASVAERAMAKQLKAYLLFFDQILASYFAHLEKVKDIFSIDGTLARTYFTQLVEDIKDLPDIVSANYTSNEDVTDLLFAGLDDSQSDHAQRQFERRNEVLDHLLARFAENFSEYAFLMKQLYGSNTNEAVTQAKENFLQNYEETGCERGLSFNYYKQAEEDLWDTLNVSTFQKRIALLSGNPDASRRDFSDDPLEIYEEVDEDGKIEYRFRFRNDADEILASGTKHYHNLASLYAEILNVKNYGRFTENYEIKTNISGRFYFNLVNPTIADTSSEEYIIARRIPDFATEAEAITAIEETAAFIATVKPNEGMYVIEHILLRPDVTSNSASVASFMPICEDNCEGCEGLDPYSFRVSIVLPGWTERYSNIDFRRFMEDLIRRELPSHIVSKICWIGYPESYDTGSEENEMMVLEDAYKAWLFAKTTKEQDQPVTKLKELIRIMSTLHTIYAQGRLHNCDDDEEQQNIILGRTNLGKI